MDDAVAAQRELGAAIREHMRGTQMAANDLAAFTLRAEGASRLAARVAEAEAQVASMSAALADEQQRTHAARAAVASYARERDDARAALRESRRRVSRLEMELADALAGGAERFPLAGPPLEPESLAHQLDAARRHTAALEDRLAAAEGRPPTSKPSRKEVNMGYPHSFVDGPTVDVLAEIAAERRRQNAKWGEQNHPDGTGDQYGPQASASRAVCEDQAARRESVWAAILLAEVWEALAESDPERLRAELVQVAAVSCAWISAIDRRVGGKSAT